MGRLIGLMACFLVVATATPAMAEVTVVVLGVRSVEGDDDFANELTQRLRSAAMGLGDWTVSDRAVSMSQMTLAHGCDEVDASCLNDMAKGLEADRIIYGTVRRTSARKVFNYAVTVSLFNGETGSIERSASVTISKQASASQLEIEADRLIERLAVSAGGGVIAIKINVKSAEVRLNGKPVGRTRNGTLRLEGVRAGDHKVEILARGYTPHETTVSVSEDGQASVSASLTPLGEGSEAATLTTSSKDRDWDSGKGSGGPPTWVGYGLLGVGGASLVGMVVSWVIIQGIDDDETFLEYKDAVASGTMTGASNVPDVCVEALKGGSFGLSPTDLGEVQNMCNTADVFEVLQWVFLGTAVVAGGLGTYFVLTSGDSDAGAAAPKPALAVTPTLSPDSAHVTATLRF